MLTVGSTQERCTSSYNIMMYFHNSFYSYMLILNCQNIQIILWRYTNLNSLLLSLIKICSPHLAKHIVSNGKEKYATHRIPPKNSYYSNAFTLATRTWALKVTILLGSRTKVLGWSDSPTPSHIKNLILYDFLSFSKNEISSLLTGKL